jgi:hypothetical protein
MRRHLERQTRSYLKDGGEIRAVPQGVSAVDEAVSAIHTPIFTGKPQQRTPVNDVIDTLNRRREAQLKRTPKTVQRAKTKPKKEIVYDDFGEPIRVVYRDE